MLKQDLLKLIKEIEEVRMNHDYKIHKFSSSQGRLPWIHEEIEQLEYEVVESSTKIMYYDDIDSPVYGEMYIKCYKSSFYDDRGDRIFITENTIFSDVYYGADCSHFDRMDLNPPYLYNTETYIDINTIMSKENYIERKNLKKALEAFLNKYEEYEE